MNKNERERGRARFAQTSNDFKELSHEIIKKKKSFLKFSFQWKKSLWFHKAVHARKPYPNVLILPFYALVPKF